MPPSVADKRAAHVAVGSAMFDMDRHRGMGWDTSIRLRCSRASASHAIGGRWQLSTIICALLAFRCISDEEEEARRRRRRCCSQLRI